ncbi:MAG: hypothetical protein WA964_13170 [Ilumatobacter sp.]|uniref:hypothetical protein n=1 Tax=Ilumatobacter sp. TaxID=1967498 RepID=UPI003C75055A
MSDIPIDDDDLLAAVRSAHSELDPPPERLRDAAIRAATWDLELDLLVSLAHDSQLTASGLRTVAVPRDLVFESDGIAIELVVESKDTDPAISVIRGEIDPVPDRVTLRSPGRPDRVVDVDDAGRFEAEVDASLIRIVAMIGDREVGSGLITLLD